MNPDYINEDNIKLFFSDPFANEYSRYCSETIISAVAQIDAAFDYITGLVPPSRKDTVEELRASLRSQTNKLMRAAVATRTLADAEPEMEAVDVDALVAYICEQLSAKLGEKITFKLRSRCNAFVCSDRRIITDLMLGAVRKLLLSRKASHFVYYLGADDMGKNVRLYVNDATVDDEMNETGEQADMSDDELFDRFFSCTNSAAADIIGAKSGYGGRLYTLELPKYDPKDQPSMLKSPVVYDQSRLAYTCRVMLDDEKLTRSGD
ncbi:MAG: hypothetical protein IKO47_11255 [Ruminococcus sp.]|nr:hypothetical protein [Ruminococcus sp.]